MNRFLIPLDKANHFIYGTLVYFLSSFFLTPLLSLIPVIIIGALKEIYDYYSKTGTPDIVDFLYTIFGAIPVFIIDLTKS
jgi:hypothetical protein